MPLSEGAWRGEGVQVLASGAAADAREEASAECPCPAPMGGGFLGRRLFAPAATLRDSLKKEYGWQFVFLLGSNYLGVKGIVLGVVTAGQLPYYRSRGVGASDYQDMMTIAMIPWGVKGLFGTISDAWPLFGYHKRYYIALGAALGTVSLSILAFTDISLQAASMCFFFAQLFVALSDLLCEGKYAEIMSHKGGSSSVVTFVWGCVTIGNFLGSCFIGPMADYLEAHKEVPYMFCLGIPFAAQMLYPALKGYMPEERQDSCRCKFDKAMEHRGPMLLAVAQSGFALCMLPLFELVESNWLQLLYCLLSSVSLIWGSYQVLPWVIASCNFYMFLSSSLSLQILALDLWYTASPLCIPDGPMFSQTYYLSVCALVQSVAAMGGVWAFETYMKTWNVRKAFWVTTVVSVMAAMVDLVLIHRWNVDIGLPDEYTYVIGNAAVRQVVQMLNFMPSIVLVGKLCPKNIESTVFAILAGFANFGGNIAKVLGKILINMLGVSLTDAIVRDEGCFTSEGGWVNKTVNKCIYDLDRAGVTLRADCNDSNLGLAVIIAQCLCPLLTVPLTFVLIPDKRLNEDFLVEGNQQDPEPVGVELGSLEPQAAGRDLVLSVSHAPAAVGPRAGHVADGRTDDVAAPEEARRRSWSGSGRRMSGSEEAAAARARLSWPGGLGSGPRLSQSVPFLG